MTDATVAALADLVGGRLIGDGERRITGLGDLRTAGPDRIGFVRSVHYHALAATTRAGAVLANAELRTPASQIVVDDVDLAYARVAQLFHPLPRATEHTIHATAVVDPAAVLEAPVSVGPHAVIGKSRIGAGTVVMAGVAIGDGVVVGPDCVFHPNVVVYDGAQIGARVVLHANAVIAADGFGYARQGTSYVKVPQLGTVVLEDDVEIGACSTVDRATLGATRVGARTKIDNLCHVAHNCVVGADTAMAAGGMMAGSTSVGERCVIAGQVGISGHLKITDDVKLGGGSVILRDVTEPGEYMGHPLLEKRQFVRLLRKLRAMVEKPEADGGD